MNPKDRIHEEWTQHSVHTETHVCVKCLLIQSSASAVQARSLEVGSLHRPRQSQYLPQCHPTYNDCQLAGLDLCPFCVPITGFLRQTNRHRRWDKHRQDQRTSLTATRGLRHNLLGYVGGLQDIICRSVCLSAHPSYSSCVFLLIAIVFSVCWL